MTESLPQFFIDETLHINERKWNFSAFNLATSGGITTKLDQNIWLDWSDILYRPGEARMHMFPGADKKVGLAVKRYRMETWQAAIVAFNELMIDVRSPLSSIEAMELLKQRKIPRPKIVVLPTANPSLIKLLSDIGIQSQKENSSYELYAEWKRFVDIARCGGLVRRKFAASVSNS
jgi:hypothetical protein